MLKHEALKLAHETPESRTVCPIGTVKDRNKHHWDGWFVDVPVVYDTDLRRACVEFVVGGFNPPQLECEDGTHLPFCVNDRAIYFRERSGMMFRINQNRVSHK